MHNRLGSTVFAGFASQNFAQATLCVPLRLHDRVNDEVQSQTLAVDLHRHRVHQKRHVVIDDFDSRMRGLPSVFLALRIVNAQLGDAGFEFTQKIQVRKRSTAEIGNFPFREVFRINLTVIQADKRLGTSEFWLRCLFSK